MIGFFGSGSKLSGAIILSPVERFAFSVYILSYISAIPSPDGFRKTGIKTRKKSKNLFTFSPKNKEYQSEKVKRHAIKLPDVG